MRATIKRNRLRTGKEVIPVPALIMEEPFTWKDLMSSELQLFRKTYISRRRADLIHASARLAVSGRRTRFNASITYR